MFSLQTVVRFIVNYIPYGKEIESSIKGPYFYNNQVYRDEEDSCKDDLERGVTDCTENTSNIDYENQDTENNPTVLQAVSCY